MHHLVNTHSDMNSLKSGRRVVGDSPCLRRILALLLLSSTCALAEEQESTGRFYFTANLGASLPQDTTIKSTDAFVQSGTIQFSPGGRLDVGFGYYFTDWLSAELETGFLINLTKLEDELSSGDVACYQIPILANLICHIPTRGFMLLLAPASVASKASSWITTCFPVAVPTISSWPGRALQVAATSFPPRLISVWPTNTSALRIALSIHSASR